ncbi:MAG: hypothetical protein IJ733_09490, partial [Lachnospiraceae bacterium]|nr:hypothetical protein [Lachnospiraceae bacterium]
MKGNVEKLLLIKGFSGYGAVRVFMDELKAGFEDRGMDCEILDVNEYDQGDGFFQRELFPAILKALEKKPDAVLTSNGLILNHLKRAMKKAGVNIPVIAYYVDHPAWQHERISVSMQNYYTVFVDENYTDYVRTYYGEAKAAATISQAGIVSRYCDRPFSERKKSIVFFGSYSGSGEIYRELDKQSSSAVLYIKKMMEYGKLHPEEKLEDIVLTVFEKEGLSLPKERIPVIMSSMTIVERYLRSYFREQCIRALVENGIEIEIYGDGWERFTVKNSSLLHAHASVAYREMADIMTEYKYSLNVLPWAKAGFHDRLATSMLNGCFCISDTSSYLEAESLHGEKLLTWRLLEEDKMAEKLMEYMDAVGQSEE